METLTEKVMKISKKDKYFLILMSTWILALLTVIILWPKSGQTEALYVNTFFIFILAIMVIIKETTKFFNEK